MTPYNPNEQGRTCAIMVNTIAVQNTMRKMCDVLVNKSYNVLDKTGQRMVLDEISVMAILQECVNHYMEFLFTHTGRENITFEYYVDEHFQAHAGVLKSDAVAMQYLNVWFATICSQIANALQYGVADLHENGYEVETIQTFNVDFNNHMFIMEGNNYGNDLLDGGIE